MAKLKLKQTLQSLMNKCSKRSGRWKIKKWMTRLRIINLVQLVNTQKMDKLPSKSKSFYQRRRKLLSLVAGLHCVQAIIPDVWANCCWTWFLIYDSLPFVLHGFGEIRGSIDSPLPPPPHLHSWIASLSKDVFKRRTSPKVDFLLSWAMFLPKRSGKSSLLRHSVRHIC